MEQDVDYILVDSEQYTCRVCLSTDSKLFHLIGCELHNDFYNITGIQISSDDGLPQYICFKCREFLRKAAAFRNKAIATQNILNVQQVPMFYGQTIVMTPLISLMQTETLLISIPAVAKKDVIDTANIVDHSLVKKEIVPKSEHNVIKHNKLGDTEAFVKEEVIEHSIDYGIDFDVDVEVTSNEINQSDKQKVIKEAHNTKILGAKTNTKRKAKTCYTRKYPKPRKGDIEMDAQTIKNYLFSINTNNVFAKMLHKYITSRYIDKTIDCNTDIDQTNDDYDLMDSEDESTSSNKLIRVEDDSAEINDILTLQTDMEPSKRILYEFIKEKYVEKKNPAKKTKGRQTKRKGGEPVLINYQVEKRLFQTRMAMEELRKEWNMEIKFLSLEEQIAEVQKRSITFQNSPFQCDKCFRGFLFEGTYNFHMRSHDPAISGNLKCEVCKKLFLTRKKLLRHQLIHKYRFICNACGCVTKYLSVAKEHAKSHIGLNNYKCEYCSKIFSKSARRVNHIRIKHGSVECGICYDLMGPGGMKMHNIFRHPETFKCQSCDKVFNDAEALAKHKSYSVNDVCNSDEKPCTLCGERFTSESKWTSHVQEHRRIRRKRIQFKRGNPDTQASTRRSRSDKKDTESDPGRSVMCEMCGKTFTSESLMRYHQRIHTGEKPFACTYCPKRFRLKTLLEEHIHTHTGERPFQCQKCLKCFKGRTALYRHEKCVHTKARPHRCTYCDKAFQTSSCVKLHIKTVHMKIPMPPRVRNRKKRAE